MREIKFRSWNRIVQRMKVFSLPDIEKQKESIQWQNLDIMQYTGLKDKNGKEIYEGDIVKWGKPPLELKERIAEVKINPDIQFDCKNISRPRVFHFGSFVYTDTEKHLEVIGNIYEKSLFETLGAILKP